VVLLWLPSRFLLGGGVLLPHICFGFGIEDAIDLGEDPQGETLLSTLVAPMKTQKFPAESSKPYQRGEGQDVLLVLAFE
jgi:hypothetical protein